MAEKGLPGRNYGGGVENIVDRLLNPGLILFVLSKEQRELSFGLSIPLYIADIKGIWKNRVPGSVVWFSLETSRERSQQMFNGYTTVLNQIFEIYAYKYGYFGDSIKEGMDIFLEDNPHIRLVVIDSIEKIVEREIGQMDYRHVYEILHGIRQAAIRFEVPILAVMHEEDFGDGSKWTKVSDAVMKVDEVGNQGSQKYTLYFEENGKMELGLGIVFDSESGKWHQIADK